MGILHVAVLVRVGMNGWAGLECVLAFQVFIGAAWTDGSIGERSISPGGNVIALYWVLFEEPGSECNRPGAGTCAKRDVGHKRGNLDDSQESVNPAGLSSGFKQTHSHRHFHEKTGPCSRWGTNKRGTRSGKAFPGHGGHYYGIFRNQVAVSWIGPTAEKQKGPSLSGQPLHGSGRDFRVTAPRSCGFPLRHFL